jgi:uncharacterized protein (DUF2235 family)
VNLTPNLPFVFLDVIFSWTTDSTKRSFSDRLNKWGRFKSTLPTANAIRRRPNVVSDTASAPIPTKKRLAVCLDGTWNTVDDNTNVWRLKSLFALVGNDGLRQTVYYHKGVGTSFGSYIRGGMLGYGLDDEIIWAYEWLIDNYNVGDELFIFGFSRGAYTARSLSGLISKCGLLTSGAPLSVMQLYERYRKRRTAPTIRELWDGKIEGKSDLTIEEQWLLKYSQPVDIDFLGVWDTVGALGLPFGNLPILGKQELKFLNTGLRISNKSAFHALAIDEHRKVFSPTLWTVDYPKAAAPPHHHRTLAQVEQRWFVGAHANVGGGCENDLLAQRPLKWMMDKAAAVGLVFRHDIDVETPALPPAISDSYSEFAYGAYKLVSSPYFRPVGAAPIESSATERRENINETIDGSVFDRWRADQTYRPPNLSDWANRRSVDPATVNASVMADTAAEIT